MPDVGDEFSIVTSARRNVLGSLAQILRFGLVGLLNTTSALALIWLLMALGAGPYRANLAGYALGMIVSFIMNRAWTFRDHDPGTLSQVLRYLIACLISYLLNLAMVTFLLRSGMSEYVAQIGGIPVYTLCLFLMSKYVVFTPRHRASETNGIT